MRAIIRCDYWVLLKQHNMLLHPWMWQFKYVKTTTKESANTSISLCGIQISAVNLNNAAGWENEWLFRPLCRADSCDSLLIMSSSRLALSSLPALVLIFSQLNVSSKSIFKLQRGHLIHCLQKQPWKCFQRSLSLSSQTLSTVLVLAPSLTVVSLLSYQSHGERSMRIWIESL